MERQARTRTPLRALQPIDFSASRLPPRCHQYQAGGTASYKDFWPIVAVEGIVHVLKSGCRWADAPLLYGPRKTLYNRFVRWAAKGVWLDIFHALAAAGGPPAEVLIDSSAVKAHRCASGGKGGNTIRRSAARAAGGRQKSTR